MISDWSAGKGYQALMCNWFKMLPLN